MWLFSATSKERKQPTGPEFVDRDPRAALAHDEEHILLQPCHGFNLATASTFYLRARLLAILVAPFSLNPQLRTYTAVGSLSYRAASQATMLPALRSRFDRRSGCFKSFHGQISRKFEARTSSSPTLSEGEKASMAYR
jgi:hypothetical protein